MKQGEDEYDYVDRIFSEYIDTALARIKAEGKLGEYHKKYAEMLEKRLQTNVQAQQMLKLAYRVEQAREEERQIKKIKID